MTIGYFEDENAVTEWRNLAEHRRAKALGRTRYFKNYRLIMAEVVRDYTHDLRRNSAPDDSNKAHWGTGAN